MKKILLGLLLVVIGTSCSSNKLLIIPKAVNTVNAVSLKELNLERKDYDILNTVTAEATIVYSEGNGGNIRRINCPDEDFSLTHSYHKKTGWHCTFRGIVKLGYLANDYSLPNEMIANPEEVARRLAIYRLINQANLVGADGVIEPIISTSVDNAKSGKTTNSVVFKSTVSAKLIKLKSDN